MLAVGFRKTDRQQSSLSSFYSRRRVILTDGFAEKLVALVDRTATRLALPARLLDMWQLREPVGAE